MNACFLLLHSLGKNRSRASSVRGGLWRIVAVPLHRCWKAIVASVRADGRRDRGWCIPQPLSQNARVMQLACEILPGALARVFAYVALLGISRGLVKVVEMAWKIFCRLTVVWLRSVHPRFTLPVCWLSE